MSEVIDLRRADDPRDVVHRVCHALASGQLVVLPTETQYTVVGSATDPAAGRRLNALLHGRPAELVMRCADESRDYWLNPPAVLQKLSRRCWPGPVVLSVSHEWLGGLFGRLPEAIRQALMGDAGTARFRVPASPIWGEVQRLTPAPLIAIADAVSPDPLRRSAESLLPELDTESTLVIDDGPCRYGDNATVVRVHHRGWTVDVPGVVSVRNVGRLASEVYLFVCTGNTCRSPMAEALFRKLLAEQLECRPDELVDQGFVVASAGLAAAVGAPASHEAVELLAESGIDLREHESQPLTERLLTQADQIFTMTAHHRQAIVDERPDLKDRVHLLSDDGGDISDPIGNGRAAYQDCREEIERHLRRIVEKIASETK